MEDVISRTKLLETIRKDTKLSACTPFGVMKAIHEQEAINVPDVGSTDMIDRAAIVELLDSIASNIERDMGDDAFRHGVAHGIRVALVDIMSMNKAVPDLPVWHDLVANPDDIPNDIHKQYLLWDDYLQNYDVWTGWCFREKLDRYRKYLQWGGIDNPGITKWRELSQSETGCF